MVGAGPAGRVVAQRLTAESEELDPVGFVDANAAHRRVAGLPLLGVPDELVEIAVRTGAGAAVLAVPELPMDQTAELIGTAWSAGLDVHWLPPALPDPARRHSPKGSLTPHPVFPLPSLRRLPLAQLIGRDVVRMDEERARSLVAGRRVVVAGMSGPLGGALSASLTRLDPAGVWTAEDEAEDLGRLFAEARPHLVVQGVHAQDTQELEQDPSLAVTVNMLTTQRLVDQAIRQGVERLVLVSTGRAAEPVSVAGATERLAELVVLTAAGGPTRFAVVRLGDLLGMPGSLLPMLAERLPLGGTVTIAHPEAARHLMTAGEAVGLMLESAALAEEAEIFALEMGDPVPVVGLVHRYAELLGLPEVTIRFSGLGPGERLTEKSFSQDEARVGTAHAGIWATRPPPPPPGLRTLFEGLYAAALQGDEGRVRLLLRRLLPEYNPIRRPGRRVGPPEPDAVLGLVPDHESL